MEVLIRRFHQIKMAVILACASIFSVACRNRPWVLIERGTDARDNAYFFYRYLKEKHPDRTIYYIIDKKSPDYYKVKEDAVHFGSLKNYWVIVTAERIISTHCFRGLPYMNPKLFRFFNLNEKYIFLQHGITQCDIPQLYFGETGNRLFVCGAKPEFNNIADNFGYPPGVVRYTGFARYDTLHDAGTKKQILLMPTWRMYLSSEKSFLESKYYRQWNQLLTDPQLALYLENNDLTAVFYPHIELQKYLHLFQPESDRIILGDFANYDVQTLLKESKLLVTDYSSVFFDFAYMRKPVVYFQFDQDEFFGKHYKRGYFSYQKMGFGPVTECVESTVDSIVQIGERGFWATDVYRERMEEFFPLHDQNNCKRIYDAICSL